MLDWLEHVLGEDIYDLHDDLKDGTRLCKIINLIKPKTIAKINNPRLPAMQRVRTHSTPSALMTRMLTCVPCALYRTTFSCTSRPAVSWAFQSRVSSTLATCTIART